MGPLVLIADFASPQRELLHAVLVRHGFSVAVVGRAADAMMQIHTRSVSLVICGFGLPNADQVCAAAKAGVTETHAVLIAAAGPLPADDDAEWDATLNRPLQVEALMALLDQWGLRAAAAAAAGEQPTGGFRVRPVPKATPTGKGSIPTASARPPPPAQTAEPTLELEDLDDPAALDHGGMVEVDWRPPPTARAGARPAPVAPDLPSHGSIRDVGLPQLIVRLYRSGFTGVLRLQRHGVTREICFLTGTPVRIDSSQLSMPLEQMLLNEGAITAEQAQRARELMATGHARPGEALLATGALNERQLIAALDRQSENDLVNCIAWQDGDFTIEAGDAFAFAGGACEVHPLRALWRGVNEFHDGLALAQELTGQGAAYVVPTRLFPVHAELVRAPLLELGLWELLAGQRTLHETLDHRPAIIDRCAKAIFLLQLFGMIELRPTPGPSANLPGATDEAEPEVDAGEPQPETADYAELIARHLLFLQEADLFAALRIAADADSEAVDAAYREQVQLLRLRDPPPGLTSATAKQVSEIRAILFRAWETLHDPNRRQLYVAAQRRPPERPKSAPASLAAYDQAARLIDRGFFASAIKELEAAIAADETEPALRVLLADAIIGEAGHDLDEAAQFRAIACLEQALFRDPSHVEASLKLGGLLLDTGRLELAGDHVARVLRCAPDNQAALAMMQRLQIQLAEQERSGTVRRKLPAEIRHRLKVRCRQEGEKDAVGYTSTVGRDKMFVNTRTVFRVGSQTQIELELPIVGELTLAGEVTSVKRTHRALAVIQMESGMEVKLLDVSDRWLVYLSSLKH